MKYGLGCIMFATVVLADAQTAIDADGALRQLPMNSAGRHPPKLAVSALAVSSQEVAKDAFTTPQGEQRLASAPLLVDAATALQKLPIGAVQPGRAYVLTVRAAAPAGAGFVAMRFREPKASNTFRTYSANVSGAAARDYRIEFTAPAYTDMAEIALTAYTAGKLSIESVSLKMREPIPRTEAVADWSNSYTPAGYRLVFNDEFNAPQLDRSRWFTRYIYGGEATDRLNDEQQRYTDRDNHVMGDGALHLTARRKATTSADGINYESGMVRSDFTLRYGFLEARVKMPGGKGAWTAFWLNSDVGETGRMGWPPEIDIFEFVNNVENDKVNKIHIAANTPKGEQTQFLYTSPGFKTASTDWVAPFDFDKGWHTVGCEWLPDRLVFYVDGTKVMSRRHAWTYADGALGAPAHILLNFAVGGAWAGRFGIDDSAFPQSFDIDWVRAYQK